jgi:hypothetical protein
MIKVVLFFFMISNLLIVNSQIQNRLEYFIDVYKPYTEEAQDYLQINNQISSSTFAYNIEWDFLKKSRFSVQMGFGYKFIRHIVLDKLTSVKYTHYYSPTNFYIGYFPATSDLVSVSHSLSLNMGLQKRIFITSKGNHTIGTSLKFYFFEWYNSKYITDRRAIKEDYGYELLEPTVYNNAEIGFFPSSLTTDIFYRYLWIVSDKFNLGTRISLGTNLYSDWDQFKKYAWVGLGLEMGFGKVKGKKD